MQQNKVTGRDNRLDSVKGFLILLVVLGHIIGLCGAGEVNERVWQFVYLFHMPLFILVSGYFSSIREDERSFWESLSRLVIPLVVFQVICIVIACLFFHQAVGLSFLLTPYWTLWYLLSLVFWRVMLQFSPRFILERPFVYLGIAFIIAVFSGLIPYGRILSIQRTLNFFPFFLLGYYLHQGAIKTNLWPTFISVGIVVLFFVLILGGWWPISTKMAKLLLRGADHYSMTIIPLKSLLFLISFLLSISVLNIIPERKFFCYFGRNSMFYYLYHGLIIRFILQPLVKYFNLSNGFLFIVFYFVCVIVVLFLLERIPFFRWIINPVSNRLT